MRIYFVFMVLMYLIISCVGIKKDSIERSVCVQGVSNLNNSTNATSHVHMEIYNNYINHYSCVYGVDASLIKAIIKVESNYDPTVISKSNAIGLMQIKADTAGRDAYRLKGRSGEPSKHELLNADINIDLGTAYLSILQRQLIDIIDLKTRRYAIIVAYVNGLHALLQVFSMDRHNAIKKINKLSADQFYRYILNYHPSKQASRYLSKVNAIYIVQN